MGSLSEQLRDDSRFFIDEANLSYLDGLGLRAYRVIEIEVGEILRDYEDGLYPLSQSAPYAFLANPNDGDAVTRYCEYCDRSRNRIGAPDRSPESLLGLFATLEDEGYDMQKGAVVVDQHNIILEGQHRCCVLLFLYGEHFTIPAVQVKRTLRNPRTVARIVAARIKGRIGR